MVDLRRHAPVGRGELFGPMSGRSAVRWRMSRSAFLPTPAWASGFRRPNAPARDAGPSTAVFGANRSAAVLGVAYVDIAHLAPRAVTVSVTAASHIPAFPGQSSKTAAN